MESYSQPPANEYPCRNSGVMGLELDGLMCNKDRDRQEEFCKAAFLTLNCGFFSVPFGEITLAIFRKNSQ